jgi:D-alanine transaminase
MEIAFINEKMLPLKEVPPIYFDRGSFFGDGVYEVIRSYDGKIFALDKHLERFSRSLKEIDITGVDIDQIKARIISAFEKASISNAKIYFHVTRGSAPRQHALESEIKPNFFLTITELPDKSEEKAKGIKVSTSPDWRWKRCDIKSLNLLANVLASSDAARKGCQEAILVDESGLITEGASSAFFAIFNKRLQTTPLSSNILPSITRQFVIKAGKEIGMETIEESLTPEKACEADELFIAVTTKDIVGVVEFDGQMIGDGLPGKYTRSLMEQFSTYTI